MENQNRIPKNLHQIWLSKSGTGLPEPYYSYSEKIKEMHPDWSYKLWTYKDLEIEFGPKGDWLRGDSFAQQADIARYYILYKQGGIYLDTDMEVLKPLTQLNTNSCGFSCSEDGRFLSIGALGAKAESKFYKNLCDNIPSKLGVLPPNEETGPHYFTKQLLLSGFENDFIVYKPEIFYPKLSNDDDSRSKYKVTDDTLAIHHYAASWVTKKKLVSRIRMRCARMMETYKIDVN